MKRLLTSIICLFFASSTYADTGRVGAFFIPSPDSDPDLALDMALALTGALVAASGEKAVPYDELTRVLGYRSFQNPGECVISEECMAEKHAELKLSVLVIGAWTDLDPERVRIELRRIHKDPLLRFTRTREIPNDPVMIARNLTEMAHEMVNPPSSILVVSGSGAIEVEIDGTVIGIGPGTFVLTPGRKNIILRQNNQEVLNSQIACPIGLTCSAEVPGELPDQSPPKIGAGTSVNDPKPSQPEAPTPWLRYGGYASVALGAGLFVFAAMEGKKLSDVEGEIRDGCPNIDGPTSCTGLTEFQFLELEQQGKDHANNANMFLIAGGALTVTGIGLLVYDMLKQRPQSARIDGLSPLRHLSAFRFDIGHGATWIRHRIDF